MTSSWTPACNCTTRLPASDFARLQHGAQRLFTDAVALLLVLGVKLGGSSLHEASSPWQQDRVTGDNTVGSRALLNLASNVVLAETQGQRGALTCRGIC